MKPDILVSDPAGRPILIVEVKGKSGKSSQWAAEFRRNVLAGYPRSTPPFFLLATPDQFHFWKKRASRSQLVRPDFSMNPGDVLKSYDSTMGEAGTGSLSSFALQFIVADWLRALAHGQNGGNGAFEWLSSSGLLEAIRGGRVVLEPEV
jgi:hypothetical protein